MRSRRLPPWVVDTILVALALLDALLSSGRHGGLPLVLSIIAALGLAVRRRWPYVTFALSMPAVFAAYVLIAPLAALYTVAASTRRRGPVALCAFIAGAGYYLPWPPGDLDWHSTFSDYLGLIYTVAYVGAPVALGLLAQTRRDLADRLAELKAGQQREQHMLAEHVLSLERARLAREMHDVVSHQVSLIAVQAGALSATTQDDAARESAVTIRELSARTLDELRHMIGVLRSPGSGPIDLNPQPRLTEIAQLVAGSGLDATVDLETLDGRTWSEPIERAAYRTVQEGLTNAGKHAPGAAVTICVAPHGTGLIVTVRNGPPATPLPTRLPTGGHGLVGLYERAELLGGTFEARPTREGGFLLRVLLPDASDPGDRVTDSGATAAFVGRTFGRANS